MSLFSDFTQGAIIQNPKATYSYKKALEIKKETEPVKTWKEIRNEMREKLTPEEYKKWLYKETYQRKKEDIAKKYQEKKAEEEAYIEEIYKEVYDILPEPQSYDDIFTQKYRCDDIVKDSYIFSWWSSRLARMNWNYIPKQKNPFRISKRYGIDFPIKALMWIQDKAYNYLKPYLEEIKNCKYYLSKKQYIYSPIYYIDEPLRTIADNWPVNAARIINVADWMIRWKFIASELYLWRNSFIFWDVLVTNTWNTFRIALENNLPWLTKDTVEDIHKLRIDWRKNKWKVAPPIYIVNDAYLIKIQPNERETLFYIVPT